MNDLSQERLDGAMLVGFESLGDTFATQLDNSVPAQTLYYYLEPIANWRSVDERDTYIVSWRPSSDGRERIEDWRGDGLSVPEDVSISSETLRVLVELCGQQWETEDDGLVTDIHLPPLSKESLAFIKQEILTRHGIIATGGYGVEPLRLDAEEEESVEEILDTNLSKP